MDSPLRTWPPNRPSPREGVPPPPSRGCKFSLDSRPDRWHNAAGFIAPVAQLDRAPDFESVGRRFESCRARFLQKTDIRRRKTEGGALQVGGSPRPIGPPTSEPHPTLETRPTGGEKAAPRAAEGLFAHLYGHRRQRRPAPQRGSSHTSMVTALLKHPDPPTTSPDPLPACGELASIASLGRLPVHLGVSPPHPHHLDRHDLSNEATEFLVFNDLALRSTLTGAPDDGDMKR